MLAIEFLDETLSFGVLGSTGLGLCEHFGVASGKVDAILGSLEHALAGMGGFCAGRRTLVDHQRLAGEVPRRCLSRKVRCGLLL